MLSDPIQGATASTLPPVPETLPESQFEIVRHMLFGSLSGVQRAIQELHHKHYAEPNDWSKPISTGRPNEVMAILTKKVKVV